MSTRDKQKGEELEAIADSLRERTDQCFVYGEYASSDENCTVFAAANLNNASAGRLIALLIDRCGSEILLAAVLARSDEKKVMRQEDWQGSAPFPEFIEDK